MQHFDVVILGAGPAGAATALALRQAQPRLSSVLVEASDFLTLRPGEILTAEAAPVLQQLEVFDCFVEQNHQRLSASSSAWGSPVAAPNAFTGIGPSGGWHIDRDRFDSMLAGAAAVSGVAFIRGTLADVQTAPGGHWQLTIRSATKVQNLNASFVVDATGRGARFASHIGIPQVAHDTLVGVVRSIGLEHASQVGEGALIEAFEHGWWYSAPLPGNRLVITAMTDADISKRLRLTELTQWSEQLCHSPLTQQRVANVKKITGEQCVRAAHTRSLHAYSGKNWMAVGDAATSVDPLSAPAILRALRFGIRASDAIGEHFNNRQPDFKNYDATIQAEFQSYLSLRAEDYRKELRWENSPFWARRHTPPNLQFVGSTERGSAASITENVSPTNDILRKRSESPPLSMR